jgi:tRNA threonylcarbamoyladenosine biosynthesis protein TsaE
MLTESDEETRRLGEIFSQDLLGNEVVCFFGDLGAGKTTFIQGVIQGFLKDPSLVVSSPTFVYLQIYQNVCHFDLYRLKNEKEFMSAGFDEFFFSNLCLIEWSERIVSCLPSHRIEVHFKRLSQTKREITWSKV